MNQTDYHKTQLIPQTRIDYHTPDTDLDIANISDELATLMAEFESKHGRPLSRRDIMWWQGFHQPPRETMNPSLRLNQEQVPSDESAAQHTAYIDALTAAVAAGEDTGYDAARLEQRTDGPLGDVLRQAIAETVVDTQPQQVHEYLSTTGEQLTGASVRFAEKTKQLPIDQLSRATRTAEQTSAGIKLMMVEIDTARKEYVGAPHNSIPKEYRS